MRFFASLFNSVETDYSPAAENMEQGRVTENAGDLVGIKQLVLPADVKRAEAEEYEAEAIAKIIKHAIDTGLTIPVQNSNWQTASA